MAWRRRARPVILDVRRLRGRWDRISAQSTRRGISMDLTIELEQEEDGRWIADIPELPGTLAYGATREEAVAHVQALALRVLADRLEHGDQVPDLSHLSFIAA